MPRRADEPETASNHIRPNRRTTTAPVRTRPDCDPSSPQCQRVVTAITPQISNRCEKSGLGCHWERQKGQTHTIVEILRPGRRRTECCPQPRLVQWLQHEDWAARRQVVECFHRRSFRHLKEALDSERHNSAAQGPKVRGLSAGGEWIRKFSSAYDK